MSRIEISKKLVLINSASSLATRMLSLSVLVWLQQYLLKRISPEEYSLLPLLYSVMAFAPLITTVLTGGLGRFITVAYARDDDDEVTRIVSTMFPILCVAGVLFLAGGWTFAWYIDRVLTIAPERVWDARIMMAILMFSAAVRLPLAPFGAGFFVRQKFVLQNLIQVGTEVFRLTLLFTLLFGVSTRVLWIITASTVAELVNLAITRSISMRLVPALRFRIKAIHWPIAKEITSFGGWNFVGDLADTIRTSVDPILLNRFAAPVDVATFHVGTLPWRHLKSMLLTVRGPLGPAMMGMCAVGDAAGVKLVFVRVGRMTIWAVTLLTVPAIAYHSQLAMLYVGSQYMHAGAVLFISLLSLPIGYAVGLGPTLAAAKGEIRPWVVRGTILHAANLAITAVLVCHYRMGAVGSVLGTAIAECIGGPLLLWPEGLRLADVRFSQFWREAIAPGFLPGMTVAALHLIVLAVYEPDSWLALGVLAGIGGVIHVFLIWPLLRPEDRRLAASAFRAARRLLPRSAA